jgi:glucosamine-6-phosphate deaminase
MKVRVAEDRHAAGAWAADRAGAVIAAAIRNRGRANIILATGASQFFMLARLVARPGLDWSRVTLFHLDEYIGLDRSHPASFVRYLHERFVSKVRALQATHFLRGDADPKAECTRMGALIQANPIDMACIGIGENGHLAFNDPPADFDTEEPYLVVTLDEACRRQQLGEGWFAAMDDVPRQAISMSIRQILKSACIVCTVSDARKAQAVRNTMEGPVVTNRVPASILRTHANCDLVLDGPAAALLSAAALATCEVI